MSRFTFAWLMLAGVILIFSGCGGGASVTGTAKLEDGTPLTAGEVEFNPITAEGGGDSDEAAPVPAVGTIGEDGTFTLGTYSETDGAAPGKYKVLIFDAQPPISERYMEAESTPLEVEVKSGEENHFEFKLQPGS